MKVENHGVPVQVLSIQVSRHEVPRLTQNSIEYTNTGLESYYILPDEARAGPQTRKLSYQEAVNLLIV